MCIILQHRVFRYHCIPVCQITVISPWWRRVNHRSHLVKRNDYFKKNYTYLGSLCLHEQNGDTSVIGWPQFGCHFNVFADLILPHDSHCIDITASPRTYQRRYRHVVVMLYNVWLNESSRAPAFWCHDRGDDRNMVVLPIVGDRLAMLTSMLMRWKVCKF